MAFFKNILLSNGSSYVVVFTQFCFAYDSSYVEVLAFLSSQPSKLFFSLFLISMFFYSALSISEVFEDYIHVESTKKLLNIGVFLSSLIIPLFTIVLISNL